MKKSKIVSSFGSYADSNFETLVQSIKSSMQGNPNFPNPVPEIAVFANAVEAYSEALLAAQSRSKNDVAAKNQAKLAMLDFTAQLAASVTATANGDKTMLISSGFPLTKAGETTPLQKPENLQVVNGVNPGEQLVSVKAVKNAKGYIHQYTPDPLTPGSAWVQTYSTTSRYTFKNLQPAQKYWFRVTAVGTFQQEAVSDALCRVVQ
jgi:hypothetical protein